MPTIVSFIKFKECLNQWTKLSEKGEQCLSKQVLGQPTTDLENIIIQIKKVLDTMLEEYQTALGGLNMEETLKKDNNDTPEELIWMKHCIAMYDQEFMVKECINGIVSTEGFTTQQHLAGSIALWKAESYLDDEIQQKIKQLK